MSIPISVGSGAASVAAEVVAGLQYQKIEVLGQGGSSVMAVNPDGSINASIIGTPNVNVSGSVFATISGSGSIITVWKDSSVIAITTGSVVTIPTGNQSVSGVVGASIIGAPGINIINTLVGAANVATQTDNNTPGNTVFAGSFGMVFNESNWDRQRGNSSIGAVVNTRNSSVITVWQNSSIIAINAGSVVTIVPGSVITVWKDSSILAVPVGSTLTVWGKSPSIVGTYAEDAAHATGDKGIFVMQVRNDTMSSITSADGDYSPIAGGPVGETIVANSPITKWVQGTADFRNGNVGASIQVIATGGTSVFTYITGIQVANMGSASVLVTLASSGSTLGYTIAPAGGGSNIYYPNALKSPSNGNFAASLSGIASVLVSAQGFIAKI